MRSRIYPRYARYWAIDGDVDGYFRPGNKIGLVHRKDLTIKNFKWAKDIKELDSEVENPKKPASKQFFEFYFDLPNHYLINIVVTESDFFSRQART